jgi:hypothetical protein
MPNTHVTSAFPQCSKKGPSRCRTECADITPGSKLGLKEDKIKNKYYKIETTNRWLPLSQGARTNFLAHNGGKRRLSVKRPNRRDLEAATVTKDSPVVVFLDLCAAEEDPVLRKALTVEKSTPLRPTLAIFSAAFVK